MSKAKVFSIRPVPEAEPLTGESRVYIRGLRLDCEIGVHAWEKNQLQPVVFNLDIEVDSPTGPGADTIGQVLDYEMVSNAVRRIAGQGHSELAETLAEKIAAFCLSHETVVQVTVQVEKPDAISDAAGVGVIITRRQKS